MTNIAKKNLFFISTPWQLANAFEAISFFQLKNNILIVDATSNDKNIFQLKKLIHLGNWVEIIYLSNHKSNFLQYAKLIKHYKKSRYNKVFVDWSWFTQVLLANINCNDAYIIDDGLATVTYYKEIQSRTIKYREFFKKKIRFAFLGCRIFTFQSVGIFTSFSLPDSDSIKIKQHKFEYLNNIYNTGNLQRTEEVYIVGQALAEKNMMDREIYRQYVCSVYKYFPGCRVVYIPHKDETFVFENTQLFDDIEVREIDKPLELFLLENHIIPKAVVSLFSSALMNIEQLFHNYKEIYYLDVLSSHINEGPYRQVLQNNKSYIVSSKIKKLS